MIEDLFRNHSRHAIRAASDTLSTLGYSRSNLHNDFEIAVSIHEPRWSVDTIAFSDSVAHIENACVTVLNVTGTDLDRRTIHDRLRRTTAPFHLLYDHDRGFDILADGKTDMIRLGEHVAPGRLLEALHDYAPDLRPDTVQRVKRGYGSFAHDKLAPLQPLQLMLWAEDVNCEVLANRFRHALDVLKKAGIRDQSIRSRLAAQLLTSRILADTRAMESPDKVRDIPAAAQKKKFVDYFDAKLLRVHAGPAQDVYDFFGRTSFATFQPEMLRTLYKALYTAEQSRAKGRFDTPLWLTRRIWREIPIEFLPPEQRVIADMTCGWGSFLISAVERFSVLPDMGSRRHHLSRYVFGNDKDETTAELARVALLTSTGRDSWHVDHQDGRKWELPQNRKPSVIVGNPPFLGDRKQPGLRATVAKHHELANDFLSRALETLADGGYLAMVMPGSFVASESGPALRKELLNRCDISEIWEIPGKVFDAGVQPLVIFAQKIKGKALPSPHPVRIRSCQRNAHLDKLKETGIFTRSSMFPSQARWTEGYRGGNTTHVFSYTTVLDDAEMERIHRASIPLGEVAEIFTGCTKCSPKRVRTKWETPKTPKVVRLLVKAGNTMPAEFVIDETEGEDATYPNDFEEPRLPSLEILEGEKILLLSDPDPSWGKRVKLAIERRGLFPSGGFLVISPTKEGKKLGLEVLAAVIRWKVGNAWVAEHLKYRKINTGILHRLPVPKPLFSDASAIKSLKILLLRVERAAIAGRTDPAAEADMDAILRHAYGITDESVWQRLYAVYNWDQSGDQTPSFDYPKPTVVPDWNVEGAVESVDALKGTVTLWLDGFDELQTVPICPQFPGWLLRSGVRFRTMIPATEARKGRVTGKAWGVFEPANYTYLTVEEMTTRLNKAMKRRSA